MPGAEGTRTRDEKKHLEREKTAHDKRGLTLTSDKDGAGRHVRGYLDAELIPACFDDEGNLIDLGRAGGWSPAQPTWLWNYATAAARGPAAIGPSPGAGPITSSVGTAARPPMRVSARASQARFGSLASEVRGRCRRGQR